MSSRPIFKGGEFLITRIPPEAVFTAEDFTDEHKMILSAATDFVKREFAEKAELIEAKDEQNVRNWFRLAGDLGLNGCDISEEYGGEGMDKISACLVSEAMGGAHSFGASHTCQTGIGSLPIVLFGNEAQKQKYLPKIVAGEYIGAYCLTEAGAGSDSLNCVTTATLSADGRHYILNGEKIFITNGGWADVFTVFAKVDGEHFTGFIVEKGFDGFSTGPEEDKLGIRGSSTVSVILKECKVPVENVLLDIGQGHKIAFNVLNIGRYKLGASAMGSSKTALAKAVKYAAGRVQFGKKISDFNMIRSKLAKMAIRTFMIESLVYRLAAAIDDQLTLLKQSLKNSGMAVAQAIKEYSIECAIAKVYGSEALDYVVDELVQIHGGYGYIVEFGAERAYRDARISRIFEGTNEINRLVIAGTLLKNAVNGSLPFFDAAGKADERCRNIKPVPPNLSSDLSMQERILAICKDIFLYTLDIVSKKLITTIQGDQEVSAALSNMMIEIYAMESGLLRAEKRLKKKGLENARLHVAAVKAYFSDTLPKIGAWAKEIYSFAVQEEEFRTHSAYIDAATAYPMENTIALNRLIAEKIIKGKKYPF